MAILTFSGAVMAESEPEPVDNAALDYWRAAALMGEARTPEELEIVRFVERELQVLPPRVFSLWPDVGRWLLEERPVVNALADASRRSTCRFEIRSANTPALDLGHLPVLRKLTRRALAIAKAYEYAENAAGAAGIYRDLLKLVENLDNDRNISSGLVAAELLQQIVVELEGFLAREPPAEASLILIQHLQQQHGAIFHLGDYLQDEGRRISRWLLEDPRSSEERLGFFYGRAARTPGVDRLVTLSPEKKRLRIQGWVMDYESRMIRLAEAAGKPYGTGIAAIRKLDAEKAALQVDEFPSGANPLIPLLVPTLDRVYQRFLLAEGQYRMIHILSLAALYRAEQGRWPVSLAELKEATRRPIPRDPYTGNAFWYRLVQVRPRIKIHAPKWVARDSGLLYELDVSTRRQVDSEKFTVAAQDIAKGAALSGAGEQTLNSSVPME